MRLSEWQFPTCTFEGTLAFILAADTLRYAQLAHTTYILALSLQTFMEARILSQKQYYLYVEKGRHERNRKDKLPIIVQIDRHYNFSGFVSGSSKFLLLIPMRRKIKRPRYSPRHISLKFSAPPHTLGIKCCIRKILNLI
ncbi:hypothetical protein CEXT_57061 [Caerostris extrusa]|uniref:Uncharacterized protein n=1 Tax=Caerostris extrusa TaxID=172846 RepID=A0AAV4R7U2_CAEEX|nr:hypothetical protein CEXT_57061 [Caerostris extrusa]